MYIRIHTLLIRINTKLSTTWKYQVSENAKNNINQLLNIKTIEQYSNVYTWW